MKNWIPQLMTCCANLARSIIIGLSLILISFSLSVSGESYTGKIVINGVSYGEDNAKVIKGSAVNGHDKRVVNAFHSISVQGGIDVNYRPSPNIQVEITGDENLLPLIMTQVNNGVLIISSSENYQTKMPLTIALGSPHLEEISLQGSGDLNLQALNEKTLTLNISGSGDATVAGKVDKLTVEVSGSGDVNAKDLVSEQADLQITGSGNINATVTEFLKANIIGSGDMTYFGNPKKIEPNILGSGDIVAGD